MCRASGTNRSRQNWASLLALRWRDSWRAAWEFELPAPIEQQLRGQWADFDAVAKESALVELYRQAKLTHHQLDTALGLDRLEAEEVLKRHRVSEDLLSSGDFDSQLAALRKLLGE